MSSSIKWNQKKLDLKTKSIFLLYRKLEYKAKLTQKIIKHVLIISVSDKKIPKSQVKKKINNKIIVE